MPFSYEQRRAIESLIEERRREALAQQLYSHSVPLAAAVFMDEAADHVPVEDLGFDIPVTSSTAEEVRMPNWRNIDYGAYNGDTNTAIQFMARDNDNEGGYLAECSGQTIRTREGITELLGLVYATGSMPTSFIPSPQSDDWGLLINAQRDYAAERNIDPMESRAAPPTEYSFIVNWDSGIRQYSVSPPAVNATEVNGFHIGYVIAHFASLSSAFSNAQQYAERCRTNTRTAGTFNVWPRRNSNYYTELQSCRRITVPPIAAAAIENPSNVKTFKDVLNILRAVKKNPTDLALETSIMDIFQARVWKEKNQDKAASSILTSLRALTNAQWVASHLNAMRFVHPDNIVDVRAHRTDEYACVKVSKSELKGYAAQCSECQSWWKRSIVYSIPRENNPIVCPPCLEEVGYFNCRNCSELHESAVGCRGQQRNPPGYVYNYGADVRHVYPKFGDTDREKRISGVKLRYGLELEVQRRSNIKMLDACVRVANALQGDAIIKSDSSIGPEGFEIVTIPATLEYHRTKLWNRLFRAEADGKSPAQLVKSWDTGVCGLHIHITRAAMTKMQLSKLLVFYHEDKNNAFLSRIAGRTVGPDAHYCKTAKKKLRQQVQTECNDHHDAITISQRNRGKTAEVRIFRGNATRHGIVRCLEFVDATVKWCAQNGVSELSYNNFLTWFNQENVRAQYPEVWKHLIHLGYLKTKHKSKNANAFLEVPETERIA